jgi:glycine/D-amino acid oxidase-like deaminating enzyme
MSSRVEHRLYWSAERPELAAPDQSMNTPFDVAIVGSGFTGLWGAWHVVDRDPSLAVLVIEARSIGSGASSRNAGYLVPHFSMSYAELNRANDPASASALAQAGAANLAETIDLVKRLEIDCDLEDAKIVTASTHPGFDARIARDLEAADALGVELAPLTRDGLRELVSSEVLSAGYWTPGATVNPRKLVVGLAGWLGRQGVKFSENTELLDSSSAGDSGVVLRTTRGSFRARRVLLAQNAWAHQSRRFRRHVLPVYTYQAVTRPLVEDELAALGWTGRAAFSDRRSILINFRLTPDDRIMFGGRDVLQPFGGRISASFESNERITGRMRESFEYVFPSLRGVPFEMMWGGPIALSPDHLPKVGIMGGGRVAFAHGCGGHGVAQSRVWSGAAVDLLFGERTARTALPFTATPRRRYPPEPARFLGGRATLRQLRRYDDAIQAGKKGGKEPPLMSLVNKVLSRRSRPKGGTGASGDRTS